ncbi:MAG: zinc-dependent metalloprotease [Acidobacteriota bacterium]|nr:zinc-dependent metalloprotease [Acidobacteriota bacterium]
MAITRPLLSRGLILISVFAVISAVSLPTAAWAVPKIEEKTAGMVKRDGFFPLYWDETAGILWLEIPKLETELLYISALSAGVGSNDIGLDRGQLGGTRLVKFRRVGPQILMVQPNTRFRAAHGDADARRAVEDSFATSILWGFRVAAETRERVLVDATDFLLRDAHGVVHRLRPAVFRLDRSRSAVDMPRTKVFPKNTEMEVTLTFVADGVTTGAGGGFEKGALGYVAPSADAVTVRQRHSLVELPDDGFKPRRFDPRSGFGAISYEDASVPLGEPITQSFIRRHRLEKKDPAADISDPVKPIIYYVDRGAPEPMRTALIEGAAWWNQAFEAAGFRNAFRVELLPEDADSLDVRYNMIQWVHRSTRGWSYGGGVTDPRTGEIIKGHVTICSLRVRQTYLMAEGLLSPYITGDETPPELEAMALARLRQLSAHEVGHAIGFGHNYYESTRGRISVMEYPHPLVTLRDDGTIDLSDAYSEGIGEWDKVAVAWGYRHFPPGVDEDKALDDLIDQARERDLIYLSNQDVDLHPRVDAWANGVDAAEGLVRMMKVRRAALDRFGENAVRRGRPLALIEEALVPLYLHHRYQTEAAISALGGLEYVYAIRGDGRDPMKTPVSAGRQHAALEAVLGTLRPSELALPASILEKLPPRPSGFGRHRELFPRTTGLVFDPLAPALVSADLTVSMILHPERAARLVSQKALDPNLPGLGEAVDRLIEVGFDTRSSNAYEAEIARGTGRVIADRLMVLAATASLPQVRAIVSHRLERLRDRLKRKDGTDDDTAHFRLVSADITRFLERPAESFRMPAFPAAPPGAPIGDPGLRWLSPWDTWIREYLEHENPGRN